MMNNTRKLAELTGRTHFKDNASFLARLYEDIHSILERLESSSEKFYCDDEDKITTAIVITLCEKGYNATEQTKKNGTVDITVRDKEDEYSWIGEAKIGYGNTKIFEGMLQLLTRYIKRDENAGLLIYFQKAGSHKFFNDWLKYLYTLKWIEYCNKKGTLERVQPLLGHLVPSDYKETDKYYHDLQVYKPCGKPALVRMFYTDVHHDPADKSGASAHSLKLGQAKNTLRKFCQQWEDNEFDSSDLAKLFELLELNIDFDPDEKLDLNKESDQASSDKKS